MAKKTTTTSLSEAVMREVQSGFNLERFKNNKSLSGSLNFKEQQWLPLSPALQDTLSIPGIPLGNIVLLRGHSDTGKTACLIEAAIAAQKQNILPVFIITEMKWNWDHAIQMGLEVEKSEEGLKGFFLYADREKLETIEDVAVFILDLLDEQKKGNLPFDLLFLWDSVGSIPCELSVRSKKNNNEWNAGAMSTQFSNNVNQKIVMSRKQSYTFTNTLVCINKVWTQKPESIMGQPKLMNKGGFSMWFDSTMIITFGNISNAGTTKIKAIKGGKQVEFAKRTNVQVEKNHVNGITTRGRVIVTPHGFISDTPSAIEKYKKEHSHEWAKIIGEGDFKVVEERDIEETGEYFEHEPE